jgi:hypothetical protein
VVITVFVFTRWQLHCFQLQLCLVSSSPRKVGQFSFQCCPLSHEISSRIHHLPGFGKLVCHSTPTLSLCASPNICSVLVCLLWEVGLLPHPCFQPLLLDLHYFTESLAPCPTPVLQGRFSIPPPPLLVLDYSLLFMLFSFVVCVWSVIPGAVLDYVLGLEG